VYAGRPRWDIGRPQPAFLSLAESGTIRGRVLDVGCGTGEHVLMCAARGLDATGVDLSTAAIDTAKRKAAERGLPARFVRHDVRHLTELGESFDTVLDCGLLVHVVDEEDDRAAYLDGLRMVLPVGGRYVVVCFAGPQPASPVRHLTPEDITTVFNDGWQIDSIEPTTLHSLTDPHGIPARLITLTTTAMAA
jgi:cyclopropane fatty-acyl-phospholipid synthase-like methyltransferase